MQGLRLFSANHIALLVRSLTEKKPSSSKRPQEHLDQCHKVIPVDPQVDRNSFPWSVQGVKMCDTSLFFCGGHSEGACGFVVTRNSRSKSS